MVYALYGLSDEEVKVVHRRKVDLDPSLVRIACHA